MDGYGHQPRYREGVRITGDATAAKVMMNGGGIGQQRWDSGRTREGRRLGLGVW